MRRDCFVAALLAMGNLSPSERRAEQRSAFRQWRWRITRCSSALRPPNAHCHCERSEAISTTSQTKGSMSEQPTLARQQARVDELRRGLGDEHPETLAAMLDLAEMLWARGRLAEGRALEEHVV